MREERIPLFVGVDTVKFDLDVSRAKAYEVIKELNAAMKAENPATMRVFRLLFLLMTIMLEIVANPGIHLSPVNTLLPERVLLQKDYKEMVLHHQR